MNKTPSGSWTVGFGWLFVIVSIGLILVNDSLFEDIGVIQKLYTKNDNDKKTQHRNMQATVVPTIPAAVVMHTYQRRGRALHATETNALAAKWGQWTFVDAQATLRPKDDYYKVYNHRDIPSTAFPATAWQKDPVYLKSFLTQAKELTERSMEAILSEYGYGKYDEAVKALPLDQRGQLMFATKYLNLTGELFNAADGAGASTERSLEGLIRRILHAIMTQDTFTVVMGGHSSAAGHG